MKSQVGSIKEIGFTIYPTFVDRGYYKCNITECTNKKGRCDFRALHANPGKFGLGTRPGSLYVKVLPGVKYRDSIQAGRPVEA